MHAGQEENKMTKGGQGDIKQMKENPSEPEVV